MNVKVVIRVVAAILCVVGVAMMTSVPVAFLMHDAPAATAGLFWSALITIVVGLLGVMLPAGQTTVRFREGFGIVTFSWLAAAVFGAIPLVLVGGLAPVDAVFETMSGFTTTGASILDNIESLPRGLLYWRSLTHWLGGMGIVVLSLAILPILGIGGMQLYKAEAPGPTSDQLTPRIANAAKLLYGVYILLSVAETALLMAGGMSLFDAWCHTCGTLATGGFSTRQASVGAFGSAYIDVVITVFMFLAGANFTLHLRAVQGRPLAYWRDEEFRCYAAVVGLAVLSIAMVLFFHGYYGRNVLQILRHAAFAAVSIMTTTGFCTEDFDLWPAYCRGVLVCVMFIGGCGGSTGGGIKVSRFLLLIKHGVVQLRKCIYPRSIVNVRLNDRRVSDPIMAKILSFFFIYVSVFVIVGLLVCLVEPNLGWTPEPPVSEVASGEVVEPLPPPAEPLAPSYTRSPVTTAFVASVATLCNIGPGLGKVGPAQNYAWMAPLTKIVLIFAMLAGRLEIYTVIVLFLPSFWRK